MTNIECDTIENIVYLKRSGEVAISEMIEVINRIDNEYGHIKNLKILDDLGRTDMKLNITSDSKLIVEEIKERLNRYNNIQAAIVASNPMQTVKAMMFSTFANLMTKYSVKVFSTKEAARHWLVKN